MPKMFRGTKNRSKYISPGDISDCVRLGSVAGPVIQATGRSEFEDGLG
jgi:hypothetical protein